MHERNESEQVPAKEPEAVTHIWVKPLTPTEEALLRLITDRYVGLDGSPLVPQETDVLVVLCVPDIRRKRLPQAVA
jgi:hypothetical protein